jgi:SAM-dependent methyltransferase
MPAQALPDDRVFRFRAVRSPCTRMDDDPEPMVQQQVARLRFFEGRLGAGARRILDWGCGSGFNCPSLLAEGREVVGFDVSSAAIRLARRSFRGVDFRVADACDPGLDLEPGTWDRIFSCEVLEHVPDVPAFLANLRRHLAPGGLAFVTTPNRDVFSLGHEPSPVNREHVKELTAVEFVDLLRPHFAGVELYGQRFREERLLRAWQEDVRGKIRACREGTRWLEKRTLRARLRAWRVVDWAYRVPALRAAWRAFRWRFLTGLRRVLAPAAPPYHWSDFEFVRGDLSDCLWLCAILRP